MGMYGRFPVYVPKVLCSEGSMLRRLSKFRGFYVQEVLCSEDSMIQSLYVSKVLCSECPWVRNNLFPLMNG